MAGNTLYIVNLIYFVVDYLLVITDTIYRSNYASLIGGVIMLITTDKQILDQIRYFRTIETDIAELPTQYQVRHLANAYNWSTAPYRPMDDQQHRICSRIAKKTQRLLSKMSGWRETDSGRIMPTI